MAAERSRGWDSRARLADADRLYRIGLVKDPIAIGVPVADEDAGGEALVSRDKIDRIRDEDDVTTACRDGCLIEAAPDLIRPGRGNAEPDGPHLSGLVEDPIAVRVAVANECVRTGVAVVGTRLYESKSKTTNLPVRETEYP